MVAQDSAPVDGAYPRQSLRQTTTGRCGQPPQVGVRLRSRPLVASLASDPAATSGVPDEKRTKHMDTKNRTETSLEESIGPDTTSRIATAASAVIAAWVVFVVVGGLEPIGRHFLILGGLRVVLLAVLIGFAAVGARGSRLGRVGLGLAAVGAVANLAGGIGSVVVDGWTFNPFAPGMEDQPVAWYPYVIGLSAFLFAVGGILTGIAGRSGGWLAVAAVLGGVLYPMAFVMQGLLGHDPGDLVGHLIWIAPWLTLALVMSRLAPKSTRQ